VIVACSSCAARFVAEGYRDAHCPTCGALAQQQAAARSCPRCELPLTARELGDLVVDECTKCSGLFVDHVAVKRVLDDRDRAESFLAALPRHAHSLLHRGRMYIPCPCCGNLMNRKLFATGSGVVVDVCRTDGMFFDAGELPAIIDFVMAGGLERAAKRDAERARDSERSERIQRALAEREPRRYDTRASAFVELLFSIFG